MRIGISSSETSLWDTDKGSMKPSAIFLPRFRCWPWCSEAPSLWATPDLHRMLGDGEQGSCTSFKRKKGRFDRRPKEACPASASLDRWSEAKWAELASAGV